jgi:hypothetical protein
VDNLFHRVFAACLAISFLRFLDNFFARAGPSKCCRVFILHSVKYIMSVCAFAPQSPSIGHKKRWMEACAFQYKFCRIVGASIQLGILGKGDDTFPDRSATDQQKGQEATLLILPRVP